MNEEFKILYGQQAIMATQCTNTFACDCTVSYHHFFVESHICSEISSTKLQVQLFHLNIIVLCCDQLALWGKFAQHRPVVPLTQ